MSRSVEILGGLRSNVEVPLEALNIGQSFTVDHCHLDGTLVKINDCRATVNVRYHGRTAVETQHWAPGAMVKYLPGVVIVAQAQGAEADNTVELKCPTCGKVCSSTSGLTLHSKTCRGLSTADPALTCKTCGKVCSSTSGLTLHMKHAHSLTCAETADYHEQAS